MDAPLNLALSLLSISLSPHRYMARGGDEIGDEAAGWGKEMTT